MNVLYSIHVVLLFLEINWRDRREIGLVEIVSQRIFVRIKKAGDTRDMEEAFSTVDSEKSLEYGGTVKKVLKMAFDKVTKEDCYGYVDHTAEYSSLELQ